MSELEFLFAEQINWQFANSGRVEFYAYVNHEKCELRMNDFPEEPLYTLTFKGQSVDFDDCPKIWSLPLQK